MPTVLKIGGHQLEDASFLSEMAAAIQTHREQIVIVHGGGDTISALQRELGIEPRYHEGLRVTDAATLRLMTMALSGLVNKRLVGSLLAAGVDALGISGMDRAIVRARAHPALPESHTGVVVETHGERILQLLVLGITPVIAPLCLSRKRAAPIQRQRGPRRRGHRRRCSGRTPLLPHRRARRAG